MACCCEWIISALHYNNTNISSSAAAGAIPISHSFLLHRKKTKQKKSSWNVHIQCLSFCFSKPTSVMAFTKKWQMMRPLSASLKRSWTVWNVSPCFHTVIWLIINTKYSMLWAGGCQFGKCLVHCGYFCFCNIFVISIIYFCLFVFLQPVRFTPFYS